MKAIVRWWKSDASLWHIFFVNFVLTLIKAFAGTTGQFDAAINAGFALGLAVLVVLWRRRLGE